MNRIHTIGFGVVLVAGSLMAVPAFGQDSAGTGTAFAPAGRARMGRIGRAAPAAIGTTTGPRTRRSSR